MRNLASRQAHARRVPPRRAGVAELKKWKTGRDDSHDLEAARATVGRREADFHGIRREVEHCVERGSSPGSGLSAALRVRSAAHQGSQ